MTERPVLLRTRSLTKRYSHFLALADVDVDIRQGGIVAIVGQAGAGKTTFIRLVAGMTDPTFGELSLYGSQTERQLRRARRHIGCVVDTPVFYPWMSARENLEYQMILLGLPNKGIAAKLLERVGIMNQAEVQVSRLSAATCSRLTVACALLGGPDLVLLDEPTDGLDPVSANSICILIKTLAREYGITFVVTGSVLADMEKLASDFIIVHKGKKLAEITHEELVSRCRQHITLGVDDAPAAARVMETVLGTDNFQVMADWTLHIYDFIDEPGRVSKAVFDSGLTLTKLTVDTDTLESYVTGLIEREEQRI